jgi:hypothetical protein
VLATAALFAFLSNVPARGVEIEEVVFEDRVRVHGLPLVVAHTGLMRWKIVFRGYVAALYLGEGVSPDDWSVDVPKRLEIVYFWAIDGKAFGRTGDEILAHNVSAEELARLHARLVRIASLYPDFAPETASHSPMCRGSDRSSPGTVEPSASWKAPTSLRPTSRSGLGASR